MANKHRWTSQGQTMLGAVGVLGMLALPGASGLPLPTLPSVSVPQVTTPSAPALPKTPSLPKLPSLPKTPAAPTLPSLPNLLGGAVGGQQSKRPTAADFKKMGSTSAANGKLYTDCHMKSWHYTLKPPSDEWTVEIFLIDPNGTNLASDALISGADGNSGTKQFNICSENTTTGTFTIKAKMNYKANGEQYAGWMNSSHFKMTKP